MVETYHATKQNQFYPHMSNVNKNITVEVKLISPPKYNFRLCDLRKANLGDQNLLGVKGANRQVLYYILCLCHHVESVNLSLYCRSEHCASTRHLSHVLAVSVHLYVECTTTNMKCIPRWRRALLKH